MLQDEPSDFKDVDAQRRRDAWREPIILQILAAYPGLTRDEIIEQMEAHGF